MSDVFLDFKIEAKRILLDALKSIDKYKAKPDFQVLHRNLRACFYGIQGGANLLKLQKLKDKSSELFLALEKNKEKDDFSDDDLNFYQTSIAHCVELLENQNSNENSNDKLNELRQQSSEKDLIYIVEDESFMQELLEEIVGGEGYRIKIFGNGEEAIENFKKAKGSQKPSCILTDLTMPMKSGLQLIQEIQEVDPFLPVIFISGDVTKDTVIRAINYGVFGVIEKPFRPEHVISVLNNAVRRFQLTSLLDTSIQLLNYQLANISDLLHEKNRTEELEVIKSEITNIMEKRKRLFRVEQNKKIRLF